MRLAIIFTVVFVPIAAYASTGNDTERASLLLNAAIAAMQVYLTSKLPAIDKRLAKIEQDFHDYVEGVVR